MTANQIARLNYLETARANREKENETHRANVAKEYENVRHNLRTEDETERYQKEKNRIDDYNSKVNMRTHQIDLAMRTFLGKGGIPGAASSMASFIPAR